MPNLSYVGSGFVGGGNWTSIRRFRTGADEEAVDLEDPALSADDGRRFYRLRVE